jgi:hypothetical protein
VDRTDLASRAGAAAVFVSLLREADTPLSARGLKQRLLARGVDGETVDAAWRRAQPTVRGHPDVCYDAGRGSYRYDVAGRVVPALTADEAFDRLLPARTTARRAELASIVRAALKERDDLEARLRAAYADNRAARAAHERQMQIDAVRALAEVVSEVEELAAAGADCLVTAERVRALAQAFGLAPIGRAGEQATFDPTWHSPIGARPPDGSRVAVIRPGYTWPTREEVVLIHKAQVAWLGRS